MGILNLSTDSFYDGGKFSKTDQALKQVEKMLLEGAFFIDLGAASSKPGSTLIAPNDEKKILLPVLEKLVANFPEAYFSIDTYNSSVANATLETGASMINDISAGTLDPAIVEIVSQHQVPYVVMHMHENPSTMQQQPTYENISVEIKSFLIERILAARNQGVKDIVVDPGFGFGKTLKQNYQLLSEMHVLKDLNCPILMGVSRKSMIYNQLGGTPETALNGTTALHAWGLERGASILRVHDVKEAKECIDLWTALQ